MCLNAGALKENIDTFSHLEVKASVRNHRKPGRNDIEWGRTTPPPQKSAFLTLSRAFLNEKSSRMEGEMGKRSKQTVHGEGSANDMTLRAASLVTEGLRQKARHIVTPLSHVS